MSDQLRGPELGVSRLVRGGKGYKGWGGSDRRKKVSQIEYQNGNLTIEHQHISFAIHRRSIRFVHLFYVDVSPKNQGNQRHVEPGLFHMEVDGVRPFSKTAFLCKQGVPPLPC